VAGCVGCESRLIDGCKRRGGDVGVLANGHAGRPGCFCPGASSTGIKNKWNGRKRPHVARLGRKEKGNIVSQKTALTTPERATRKFPGFFLTCREYRHH